MTAAVTDPATLSDAGCGLSQGVPEAVRRAAEIHRASARSGAFPDHENQGARHLSPHAAAEGKPQAVEVPSPVPSSAEVAALRALLDRAPTSSDQAGESGWQAVALAAVQALDGAARVVLLEHFADTDPALVLAGVTWLEQWYAGAAERQRAARTRRGHDRRRRQRQADARARSGQPLEP